MPLKVWLAIAGWSLVALMGETYVGFSLGFAPGWANGWPFGFTIYSVWSTGISFVFFLLLMTAAVGLGAVAGAACARFGVGHRYGRGVYAAWLVCAVVLALLASLWAFSLVYADTLKMWPNGYNP